MAGWTELYGGTNTIGTTEFSLTLNSTTGAPASKTDTGMIGLTLDVNALLAGDSFAVYLYEKCRSGGTQRRLSPWIISGPSPEPLFMTPQMPLGFGWDFTIKKISGTDRSIISSIRAYT